MSDTPRTDVAGKIAAAKSIVHELCQRQRSWTMSIPARPDYDPDLVIMDALEAAERELSDLRAKLAAAEKDMKPLKTIMSLDGKNLLARFYDYDYFYKVTAAIEKERGNV